MTDALKEAVERVLADGEFPLWQTDDDRGLDVALRSTVNAAVDGVGSAG